MEQANETSPGDSRPSRNMARGGQTSGDGFARQVINDLSTSTWAFSVLACVLETGLLEALCESHSLADLSHRSGIPAPLVEGMLDVLVALGLLLRADDGYSSTPDLLPLLQAPGISAAFWPAAPSRYQSGAKQFCGRRIREELGRFCFFCWLAPG
jgi:hypothetical protein